MRILTTLATIVVAMLLTSAYAQTQGHAVQDQTEAQGNGSQRNQPTQPPALTVRILEEPEQANRSERREQEAADREKQDLVAQQSVASSTETLVDLTERAYALSILQALIGVAGTMAVLYTIFLNSRATGAAVRAAQAAERAAVAAENALYSERAWLVPEGLRITPIMDLRLHDKYGKSAEEGRGLAVDIKWLNSGRSPAIGVNSTTHTKITSIGDDVPNFVGNVTQDGGGAIGPNIRFNSQELLFSLSYLETALGTGNQIYFYGKIEYNTTQSTERKTTECVYEAVLVGHYQDEEGNVWPDIRSKVVGDQHMLT